MATRGGKRPGAGRKRKSDKYERQINAAEKRIADRLPELVENLLHLANGGYERVEEKYERVHLKDAKGNYLYAVVTDEHGNPKRDENDVEVTAPVVEFVLVERKVSIADKDRAANEYLLNRIGGKPTEHVEADVEVGGKVEVDDKAQKEAATKLDTWRSVMTEQLKSLLSEPPTSPPAAPT